ncbi:MAG: site-specific integrase [Ruminococcaceae bacterium]|nr:site-specific integrase [Oscillospiraceae bacterium]
MPSYEQSKTSKLWSVRFRETSPDGTTKQKRLSGYATKKAAQYGYEEYILKKSQEPASLPKEETTPGDMLFDTLLEYFYKYKQGRVKSSSFYEIKRKIDKRILPAFAGQKLKNIKPLDVLNWQNEISAQFSYNYTSDLMTMLTSIYKYGEKYHDVQNIMIKVDRPRKTEAKKEMEIWTPKEFAKFKEASDNPIYTTFFTLLYITGCRRGEAEALSWSDIDFENSKIKISKSLTRKSPTAPWELTTPKNESSNRIVNIPASLREMLAEYRAWQSTQCLDATFVFGGERPLAYRSTDRYFEETCKKADIKKIRIHDLRHSCASLLISKGVSVVGVSKQLGHANIEQTLNTYSHLMPDDQSKICSELEKVAKSLVK